MFQKPHKQQPQSERQLPNARTQNTKLERTMTIPTPPGFGHTATGPSDSLLLSLTALAAVSLLFAFFVLRPRSKGGKNGPPVVTTSPVCGLPVVGTIVEFGKSPVKMVQRCYEEYGPVFTVPVRFALLFICTQLSPFLVLIQSFALLESLPVLPQTPNLPNWT